MWACLLAFKNGHAICREIYSKMIYIYIYSAMIYDINYNDEKIIPTFKRIYHIRDGVTHEEVGEGRSIGESAVQVEVKT